ncbi:MAG: hypothetical protein ACRD4X_14030 [Candidatus Acidiferrales bacterium]
MLSTSARPSVSDDWIMVLPGEKGELFDTVVGRWECAYAMMSVALDDALSLRSRGELVCARQQVAVAAELVKALSVSLTSFCTTLQHRGRALSELPVVKPLNSKFFRGNTAQSAASWNEIIHRLLFRGRSRFFHKLRILSEMLQQLEREFRESAGDIAKGMDTQPLASWLKLDDLHYDFNTCLRETEVVLKSFLRALPTEQLAGLAYDLDALPTTKPVRLKPRLSRATA